MRNKLPRNPNSNYLVKFLLDQKADINRANEKGSTPLRFAIEGKKLENVELLLKRGADAEKADHEGDTFLVILLS